MAGILSRVVRTTSGTPTVVIPEQGNEITSFSDMFAIMWIMAQLLFMGIIVVILLGIGRLLSLV